MREAMDVRPGTRALDAGCGIGLEARRLATEHLDAHVVGLDRNAELLDVAHSFAVSEPVWQRIVHDTLREADPGLSPWLADSAQRVADGGLSAVFTGILTTARVPG
jgi:trans-aconitate methyltransferase